jgi:putative two-component system hydrogenase maturation factor HypX/HoxX
MKLLFLTHAFNSLTQRLYVELTRRGHDVSVEFDINDSVTREAITLFEPDVIVGTFLKRAIPRDVWQDHLCLIVHPGPPGDRGPSSLDWAILDSSKTWGVTVLQAEEDMDAGPVWGSAEFPMTPATKSSLYRNDVTEAALEALLQALDRIEKGSFSPERLPGTTRPFVRQADRQIDWEQDNTETVLRKIRSADGQPGVLDCVLGNECYLYDAHPAEGLSGAPGTVIAHHNGAICRATTDGAVWIGHLRQRSENADTFKLPADIVLGEAITDIPEHETGYDTIHYREDGAIGYLSFPFCNGAMSTRQCHALRDAVIDARNRPTQVLCLMGGDEFWSNGINLNVIEASERPAETSWDNINAMDDLVREIILTTNKVTVSVMRGNAGAGGVFLALAADKVVARDGIVLNPHYKNMGNLYGSEYWTYLLPLRSKRGPEIMGRRLPIGVPEAKAAGLIDEAFGRATFKSELAAFTNALLAEADELISDKRRRRTEDEQEKPLDTYRDEELARMKLNFFGFDPSYHVARYYFVHKTCHSRTPPYLAKHRSRAETRKPEI